MASYSLNKSDKDPSEFDSLTPELEIKLEFYDRRKNHNKFWHIRVYDRYIVRHWGRHGSKGQKSVHSTWTASSSRAVAEDLAYEKKGKGYVKDETTVLDRMVRETG